MSGGGCTGGGGGTGGSCVPHCRLGGRCRQPLPEVSLAELPSQARTTYRLIFKGGPFPYDKDGTVFGNRERLLPSHPRGYYREYTVKTPCGAEIGGPGALCVAGSRRRSRRPVTTPATTTTVFGRSSHERSRPGGETPPRHIRELVGQRALHYAYAPRFGWATTSYERITEMDTPSCPEPQQLLRGVRGNIVQSIRAFRIADLQQAARKLRGSIFCTRIWPMPKPSKMRWI